ncbi:hypothetical protein BD410DRAFT_378605 [Rickenella mellea]|uniref:RING-type domain-containing protein n=1 Tax=Rickenella mellea TaxID=50990 RepID=A0A4Y7PY57_9AGAM|nr:hypothetical protein BD410DRAFT_378605 [Rickenella mellea]
MPLPEPKPQKFSETEDCAICLERLVIPNSEEEGASYIIDDVQLLCQDGKPGHHFHWSCLQEFDQNDWDRQACPYCRGNPLTNDGHLIAIVKNEGGVTGGFDIGEAFDDEKEMDAQPLSWKKERALLSCLQFSELDEAEILLRDEGVSPDAFHEEGHMTALHMAAMNNDVEGARLLLRYGADVNIQAETGQTAVQIGEEMDAKEFVRLLKDHISASRTT